MNPVIIDVREKDEFDAEHVENSIHIPLSNFERQAPAILKSLRGQQIVFMCRSGKRATLAATTARRLCDGVKCDVFEGGILEWKNQGRETAEKKRAHLPIMRQVQLGAGAMVLLGSLMSHFVHPGFLFLTGFVGAGLAVAGATGFCGLAEILARMPWNRTEPRLREEMCTVSPRSNDC